MIERRQFLKRGTSAVLIAGLGPVFYFSGRANAAGNDPFTRQGFEAQQGQFFHVDGGSWQSLQLTAVEGGPSDPKLNQFTVLFEGSANQALEAGTYAVVDPDGAEYELHLEPLGSAGQYRADFALTRPLSQSGCAA